VRPREGMRVVQLTPPGSACSIVIGTGLGEITDVPPGTVRGLHLVVDDIDRARDDLRRRGVDVAAIDDVGGGVRFARFADPDGNSLLLQQMDWRTGENF
jgi:predicted enzyme related to lactoylglutathione lyase